jgi:hypothetical protein
MIKPCRSLSFSTPIILIIFVLSCSIMPRGTAFAGGIQDGQEAFIHGDDSGAIRLWTPLALSGNDDAQYRLGLMYLNGRGVVADDEIAEKWLKLAAAQNNDGASLVLIQLYLNPHRKLYNPELAITLLRDTARRGVVEAERELGHHYRTGDVVAQDFAEAFHWFKEAASKGDIESQKALGELYRFGYGIPQNFRLAIMWYSIAAAAPTDNIPDRIKAASEAKIAQKEISNMMSSDELEQASQLAIACWQSHLQNCDSSNQ